MPDTIARNAHNDCKGPELTKWNLSISVNDAMPAESNVHVRMNLIRLGSTLAVEDDTVPQIPLFSS